MPTKRSKPSRTKKTAESETPTRESLSARGLHVHYDWELNHVPAAFKKAAEIEKVKRQATQKDYGHTLAETAKILGCKPSTLRSLLHRNKDAFPMPEYHRDSRRRKIRLLRETEIAFLREKLEAGRTPQA